MKKLKIYLSLLLCTCFLCSCAGNTTESTPDNASSDITSDTESSINDVSDNGSASEESSKEPTINDTFSIDKVVWYDGKFNTFANFERVEGYSIGLMEHVAENADKDIWYPVIITISDYFYDYGCVVDEEYTKQWFHLTWYPREVPDEVFERASVCYVTPQLLLEAKRRGYGAGNVHYTWMPHPDNVRKVWHEANDLIDPDILDSFSMDKVVWYPSDKEFEYEPVDTTKQRSFEEVLSQGFMDCVEENSGADVWYPIFINKSIYEKYCLHGCIVDEEYSQQWKGLFTEENAEKLKELYAEINYEYRFESEVDDYKVCYVTELTLSKLKSLRGSGREIIYTWMPHPDEVEERFANAMKTE